VTWKKKLPYVEIIVSNEEIRCEGCSSHKTCTYHLVECTKAHNVVKCNQCAEFPCEKISNMLEKAFFDKENNLRK